MKPLRPFSRAGHALERALAVAALAFAVVLPGCDSDRARLLTPSGEPPQPRIGVITGKLDFGDGSFPKSLVLAAKVTTCGSDFTTIQIVGTNTTPVFNFAVSPSLTQLSPCAWIDTLSIPQGNFEWKFGTNGNFDESPDYGRPGAQFDGLEGTAIKGAPGGDGNLAATVTAAQAGLVVCQFDETRQPAPYSFKKMGATGVPAAFTSTTDGRFTISGLTPGLYNVLIRAPGKAPRVLTNIAAGATPTDLGTISYASGNPGGIRGTLQFDPKTFPDLNVAPYPPTTVRVYSGTFLVDTLVTDRATNTFQFSGLAPDTYTLVADARLFGATTLGSVVVATAVVDVGIVTLAFDFNELPVQMNVAGDWNGFTLDTTTEMNQNPLGVWNYDTPAPITAGTYNFKVVTDGSFDNPTDYGGDESQTLVAPLTNQPIRLVSGFGTALHVQFPSDGNYRFILDERRQVFSIQPLTHPGLAVRRTR